MSLYLADSTPLPLNLKTWAEKWQWPVINQKQGDLQLQWRGGALSLCHRRQRLSELKVDFIELWRTTKIGKQDPFAKAIGLRHGLRHVVDATAGLGGDLIKLLKLGCTVTAFEQSPVVYALLEDGLRRANLDPRWVTGGGARLDLNFGKVQTMLEATLHPERATPGPCSLEVIYLDPMFAEKNKSALSKGEMQMLQQLLADEEGQVDLSELLSFAKERAMRRVVLKRPRLASNLPSQPDLQFSGQSVRYDVWLKTVKKII